MVYLVEGVHISDPTVHLGHLFQSLPDISHGAVGQFYASDVTLGTKFGMIKSKDPLTETPMSFSKIIHIVPLLIQHLP